MRNLFSPEPTHRLVKVGTLAVALTVTSSLAALWFPVAPVRAADPERGLDNISREDYESCAAGLRGAGVADGAAAAACARALFPTDVSRCVIRVKEGAADLTVDQVLESCRRVRRPIDLATCYTEIRGADDSAPQLNVLENCRRSLLPTRFSSCVVGLRTNIQFAAVEAMATCIAAGDRPQNVLPAPLQP